MAALSLNDKAHLLGRGHVSARFWSAAVSWQLERIKEHVRGLYEAEARTGVPTVPVYKVAQPIHAYDALEIDAHFLLIAVRNILAALCRQEKELGPDSRLATARQAFDARFKDVRLLRDALEHLDEYVVGIGRHQERVSPEPRRAQPLFVWAANDGDIGNSEFRLGAASVSVVEVADAAIHLASEIEEIRSDRAGSL